MQTTANQKQDELKTLVGLAALEYVRAGEIIGVGTGSTVNKFIEALATKKDQIKGAVSSSEVSTQKLLDLGIPVFDANDIDSLSVYIDGADEIDANGYMIKGGGAALTREKIVASLAQQFICIADESKLVECLGKFPLPVEVIPMAAHAISQRFEKLGGQVRLRLRDGKPLITDNAQYILDVYDLQIPQPLALEKEINQWPGVVTVGIFAQQKATICLLACNTGIKKMTYQ